MRPLDGTSALPEGGPPFHADRQHLQVTITAPRDSKHPAPGAHVDVDAGVADLLAQLWRRGMSTAASCHGAPARDVEPGEYRPASGESHVIFPELRDAAQFHAVAADLCPGGRVTIYAVGDFYGVALAAAAVPTLTAWLEASQTRASR